MKDYDESVAFLGHWGCFQKTVFFVLCASTIPNGTGVLSIIFVADTPQHHCMIPEVNLTREWLSVIIPVELVDGKQQLSRCSRFRLDVVRNLSDRGLVPGRDVNLTQVEQEGCVDGWSYSTDVYRSTIVTEFDLVCSNHWKQPFSSTIYFLGILFGSFFSGMVADRCGRKPVFFATMAIQAIFSAVEVFSPSWAVLCVLLFFSGFGQTANYLSAFVLGSETLTGNIRIMFSSVGMCLCFSIGYMILPLLAYFLRDWRSLVLAVSLPGLLYIPFWWIIPESPRWLVTQGRVKEAEAIVRDAAKKNKVEAPLIIFQDDNADDMKSLSENGRHHNILDLIRTRRLRVTTAILCLLWFSLITGYYGLSLNSVTLSGNPYISCFISGAVEIPAYVSCWLALLYLPRRPAASGLMLLGGMSLLFIQLVPKSLPEISVVLEMLGKYGFTTSSTLVYVYTAEVYPTVIRSTASGTCATFSRVGTCIAPFLFQLSVYYKSLPHIILGSLAVVCAFATIFLPETFGRPLPETMEEMHKSERVNCPCITREEAPEPAALFECRL